MFVEALFNAQSIIVLAIIAVMMLISFLWYRAGQRQLDILAGGLQMLRRIGSELSDGHPIRRRLESAPVVDLSFEEIAKLMVGQRVEPAARELVQLEDKISWMERFSQYAVQLGILGTVFALVTSDPTDLEAFRGKLPIALGTTFWGLIGAVVLSSLAGAAETVLDGARHRVRQALLDALEDIADPTSIKDKPASDLAFEQAPEQQVPALDDTEIEERDEAISQASKPELDPADSNPLSSLKLE